MRTRKYGFGSGSVLTLLAAIEYASQTGIMRSKIKVFLLACSQPPVRVDFNTISLLVSRNLSRQRSLVVFKDRPALLVPNSAKFIIAVRNI